MPTTITSTRNAIVVTATARLPKTNVMIEVIRCGFAGLARRRKSETMKVRKDRAAATGWRTKGRVVAVEIVFSSVFTAPK